MEDSKYRLALCYFELSPKYNLDRTYTRYAITELQNYLDVYPSSKYSSEAEKKSCGIKEQTCFKIYSSAELYFNVEKYKSALVYYDQILNDYFDSDYADDAFIR